MDTASILDGLRAASDWIVDSCATKSNAQEALQLDKARTELRMALEKIEERIHEVT